MLGTKAEVFGLEVIDKQVKMAKEKMTLHRIQGEIRCYDGQNFPDPDNFFDAVYSSDVLGHVKNVPVWLKEINRILKPGGVSAMFSESKLGKHSYIRNYLMKNSLNVDPHAEFHISLFSKEELRNFFVEAGFQINTMISVFWASFFVHPDEFYLNLQKSKKFPILRRINWLLFWLKKIFHPVSTATAELYGLLEAKIIGKKVEAQGYIITSRKSKVESPKS
jgi:2-polyprenyl-3-methyl-5-hydroxy-6-metoxy-1,4-benzoquinol methylase